MTSDAITDKILRNSLVMEKICQHLTFRDHLRLIEISEEFRDTLIQFIWRSLCKDLIITERNDNYLLQFNGSDYYMKQKKFFDFLHLNKLNVKKANLRNCTHYVLLHTVEQMENIRSLELQYCKISNANVEAIATNCLRLKILIFDRCIQSSSSEVVLGRDITVKTLAKCPSLKELCVYNRYKVKMNYETMQEIFQELRLSKLVINTTIIHEGSEHHPSDVVQHSLESFESLRDLSIGRFSNRGSWSNFLRLHLPYFRNLRTLSIFIDLANCVLINDAVVQTIRVSCPHLIELFFKQCKFQVQRFALSPMLQQLSLEWCWGITWQNLKQVLTEHNVLGYTSINGHYNGDDVDLFYHVESLHSLTLETSLIKDIVGILCSRKSKFPNVCTLNWLNSSESCHTQPQEIRQKLSEIFPKLQKLHMEQSYLPAREIQQLRSLQVLQFSLFDNMSWSYLLNLLEQTQTLTHLTIDMPSNVTSAVCPILNSKPFPVIDTPTEMASRLQFLKIPLEIFQTGLEFWLDLIHINCDLKLMFFNNYSYRVINQMFLTDLLNNEKFPQKIKSINICNRDIDCKDLLKDFSKCVNRYEFVCNSKGQYFIVI